MPWLYPLYALLQVQGDSVSFHSMENPVMYSIMHLSAVCEAQFTPDGPWTLSAADLNGLEQEKALRGVV